MKRVLSKKERALKYLGIIGYLILFILITFFTVTEDKGVIEANYVLAINIVFIQLISLSIDLLEMKMIKRKVESLELKIMKINKKSAVIIYFVSIITVFLSWISLGEYTKDSLNNTLIINTVFIILMLYLIMKLRYILIYIVMYNNNSLLIKDKLYDLSKIESIKNNFGSNLYMQEDGKKYDIFCGNIKTKNMLLKKMNCPQGDLSSKNMNCPVAYGIMINDNVIKGLVIS